MIRWATRLIAWDGILPAVLLLTPFLVQVAFPDLPDAIVPIAVLFAATAFFWRMYLGCCYIAANRCGPTLRHLQCATLLIGLLALMMLDALLMAVQGVPGRPIWRDPNELPVLIGIYAFYVACMAITLYPGFPAVSSPHQNQTADNHGMHTESGLHGFTNGNSKLPTR